MPIDVILVEEHLRANPLFGLYSQVLQELFVNFVRQLPVILKGVSEKRIGYIAHTQALIAVLEFAQKNGYIKDYCNAINDTRPIAVDVTKGDLDLLLMELKRQLEENSSRLKYGEVMDKDLFFDDEKPGDDILNLYNQGESLARLVETDPFSYIPVLTRRTVPIFALEAFCS